MKYFNGMDYCTSTSNYKQFWNDKIEAKGCEDLEIKQRLEKAGAKKGYIDIALSWNNKNDLDLHVIPPSGKEEIYFRFRKSSCGGELDVDRNAGPVESCVDNPIEHVYWQGGFAPIGIYKVNVNFFRKKILSENVNDFKIVINIDNNYTEYKGTVPNVGQTVEVCTFQYGTYFPEHVKKFHSDWIIKQNDDINFFEIQKKMWETMQNQRI